MPHTNPYRQPARAAKLVNGTTKRESYAHFSTIWGLLKSTPNTLNSSSSSSSVTNGIFCNLFSLLLTNKFPAIIFLLQVHLKVCLFFFLYFGLNNKRQEMSSCDRMRQEKSRSLNATNPFYLLRPQVIYTCKYIYILMSYHSHQEHRSSG